MSRSNQDNIESSLSELWQREKDFERAIQDAADAEHTYKVASAKAYLSASGTIDERKALALVGCETLHEDFVKKEAIAAFVKEKLKDAQSALSARQSLLNFEARTNFGFNQSGA